MTDHNVVTRATDFTLIVSSTMLGLVLGYSVIQVHDIQTMVADLKTILATKSDESAHENQQFDRWKELLDANPNLKSPAFFSKLDARHTMQEALPHNTVPIEPAPVIEVQHATSK